MNRFLHESIALHDTFGIDLADLLVWHLKYGIVISNYDSFSIGYFSVNSAPREAVYKKDANTLFVTMCAGDMKKALKPFQDDFQYIAFQRTFKNSPHVRVYDMKKFINKLNK